MTPVRYGLFRFMFDTQVEKYNGNEHILLDVSIQ